MNGKAHSTDKQAPGKATLVFISSKKDARIAVDVCKQLVRQHDAYFLSFKPQVYSIIEVMAYAADRESPLVCIPSTPPEGADKVLEYEHINLDLFCYDDVVHLFQQVETKLGLTHGQ
jgi:hypothetical protein